MRKEDIYLDTRLLSVEERKNLVKILEDNNENIYSLTRKDLSEGKTDKFCPYLRYDVDKWEEFNLIDGKLKRISYNEFLSLFNPLQIGETFEYNGFICEVKEEIEEKKWYVVDRDLDAYYIKLSEDGALWIRAEDVRVEEITDQEFINQLEKHSIS